MQDSIIEVKSVTKIFKVPHERRNTLKEYFVNIFHPRDFEKMEVLKDISFSVKRGEFLGIIGRNGSGKSTLLKVIAGILKPNSGQVVVNGTIAPFLELGVGFQPDLSARDNVYLYGAILGLSRETINKKFSEIIKFAELEKFVDQKLKNFSSGMQVRLAFATAIQADADILLVDEVLAVGDIGFQRKCFDTFERLKREGKTVIFVSHDLESIKQFCHKVLLLNDDIIFDSGQPERIINVYHDIANHRAARLKIIRNGNEKVTQTRWGTREAEITEAWIENMSGKRIFSLRSNENFIIKTKVKFYKDIDNPIFGIIIRNDEKQDIFVTNTSCVGVRTKSYKEGEERVIEYCMKNELATGNYFISIAISSFNGMIFYDWRDDYLPITSVNGVTTGGLVNFEHSIIIR